MTKTYTATVRQLGNGRWNFVSWNTDMTRGHVSHKSWATKAYASKVARQCGHTVVGSE